jgi:hypothetical protein
MNVEGIISSAKKKKYLIIDEVELNELLSNSKLIIEENTYISDKIRLLKFNDDLIVQEKTMKDEFLIRVMHTEAEARELINHRLEIYNRMWDGCGCKVDYYEQNE